MSLYRKMKSAVRKVAEFASAPFSKRFFGGIRAAAAQGQPGAWSADHREQARHFTGVNYIAIRAQCLQAAGATLEVKRELPDDDFAPMKSHDQGDQEGKVAVEKNHPLLRILRRPSPTQSGRSFRYECVLQMGLTGELLIAKVYNGLGEPCELYVIPKAATSPVPPGPGMPNGGWRISNITYNTMIDPDGFTEMRSWFRLAGSIIPAEDMICIRWPHPLWKDTGYGPLEAGAVESDTYDSTQQHRFHKFRNQFDNGMAITPKDDIPVEERDAAAAQIQAKFGGVQNAGKVMVTPANAVIQQLGATAKELDYVEGTKQLRDLILAIHGTPPVAAGILDGGSYAAFYASLKQFVTLTIQPMLDLLADELTEQLAPYFADDNERLVVELTAKSIDDPSVLENRLQNDAAARTITINEWRALRQLPPRPDGDVYVGQLPPTLPPSPYQPAAAMPASQTPASRPAIGRDSPDLGDAQSTGTTGQPTPESNGKTHRLLRLFRNGHEHESEFVKTARAIIDAHWKEYP